MVWQHKTEQSGNVTFRLGHTVIRVVSRTKKGTVLEYRLPSSGELRTAEFDSLILATDADSALTILGKEASRMERRVLGGVKYLHDLTVTHTDTDYMRKVPLFLCPLSPRLSILT
jgi:predicted NAD/FAD-binding protein